MLREANTEDIMVLNEIFREELVYHRGIMPTIFKLQNNVINDSWLESIIQNENRFMVVAEDNGKIVGCILFRIDTNPDDDIYKIRRFGYIDEMIVNEPFRRRGIGKKLLEHTIKELKSRDIDEVEIDVWEKNTIGQGFYKKHGFKTVRRRMKLDL
jgi:ribosomal protein S18 acetylase RimI-like enzyme